MSALPPDQREKFLIEQFSDLPLEHREKWLQIASMTSEERDKIFKEYYGTISTSQKQQMIREQYSALKTEDKERLFKENFPELPAEQRQKFEKALLTDWKEPSKWKKKQDLLKNEYEEIFDMDGLDGDTQQITVSTPKSFVAVTSSDRIRKISVVKNDFRPIIDGPQSSSKEKSSDESNTSLTKKNSKDEIIDETKNSKRKRKRKSIMKKKNSQRKASNGSSSQAEISESDNLIVDESQHDVLKESSSVPEVDVSNTSSELSLIHSPIKSEATMILPETDFHFFSDTEVTK